MPTNNPNSYTDLRNGGGITQIGPPVSPPGVSIRDSAIPPGVVMPPVVPPTIDIGGPPVEPPGGPVIGPAIGNPVLGPPMVQPGNPVLGPPVAPQDAGISALPPALQALFGGLGGGFPAQGGGSPFADLLLAKLFGGV